jgi:hypothetical protein
VAEREGLLAAEQGEEGVEGEVEGDVGGEEVGCEEDLVSRSVSLCGGDPIDPSTPRARLGQLLSCYVLFLVARPSASA